MICLGELPRQAARSFGAHTAVVCDRDQLSFAEIDQRSDAIAARLGIAAGDRVILYGENSVHWITHYYGVLKAGGIVVPVNLLLTADEVRYIADDCNARLLIVSSQTQLKLTDVLAGTPRLLWDQPIAPTAFEARAIDPDAPAAICYTSGTTGRPKGAALTHRGILANVVLTATMHGKHRGDVMLSALPCPHVYGNVVVQSALLTGARLLLFSSFDAKTMLDTIEREKVTTFEGVPTMYYYLLGEELEQRDLSSLRLCTVGGQTMPIARMKEAQARLGVPLVELWGMTELAGLGTTHSALGAAAGFTPLGSIGAALPSVEARLASLDDPSIAAPAGEAGELQVRGPIVMQGYWNNPQATAEAIDADGWLATGDIATRDTTGNYSIIDRKKDMILTAGYNIYPAEIERVIAGHAAVSMVAVAGVPDDLKGEIPCAWVVLKPGHTQDESALLDHCRAHLAAYKIPRQLIFVDDVPKTSTGKIMRRALGNTGTQGEKR